MSAQVATAPDSDGLRGEVLLTWPIGWVAVREGMSAHAYSEGLVIARHGKGVFVRTNRPLMRLGANRYSRMLRESTGLSLFRIEVTKQGRVPRAECRSVTREQPPADVADRLGLNLETSEVIRRENWYHADGEPVQIGITYIPERVAANSLVATTNVLDRGGLYALRSKSEVVRSHSFRRSYRSMRARLRTPHPGLTE